MPATTDITTGFGLTEERRPDGVHVVAVSGEVDLFSAPDLKRAIARALDAGARHLVIDLSETAFVDSTALGVLVGTVKRLRATAGRLVVVNTEPGTARTLSVTGLDQLLGVVPDREAALAGLAAAGDGERQRPAA